MMNNKLMELVNNGVVAEDIEIPEVTWMDRKDGTMKLYLPKKWGIYITYVYSPKNGFFYIEEIDGEEEIVPIPLDERGKELMDKKWKEVMSV